MRPLTDRRPKPLLPVGDRSLLERVFDTALDVVEEFVVVVGYRGDAIREAVGDTYREVPVSYVRQDEAKGTAHAVAQAEPVVDDDFLVLNGDVVVDASRHDAATAALDAMYDGEFGQPYVSDYVYDEAVTLTLKRAGSFAPARRIGEKIRSVDPYPKAYELLRVSAAVFDDAVDAFERYDDQALSFTDATLSRSVVATRSTPS